MNRFAKNDLISVVSDKPRFDLGGSYGPDLQLEELLDLSFEEILPTLALGYRTVAGDLDLRNAIAAAHEVTANDVVVTAGSIHALFLIAFILCERGDDLVLTTPAFPPTRAAFDGIGATIRPVELSFDQGYSLDIDSFEKALTSKTKLVSIASPQNPSGVTFPLETIRELLARMRRRCPDAFLVVDDVYREAAYGDDPIEPSALCLGEKVVTTASFSKAHGAPGIRLGWAITRDPELREQLVRGKFNTVISNPAVDEHLALQVFRYRDRILKDRRRLLADCLDVTKQWISSNDEFFEWVRPNAGALCCVRLKRSRFNDDEVKRFYQAHPNYDVRVSKGTWFGDEERVFRLGFGHLPLDELRLGYDALAAAAKAALSSSPVLEQTR